MRKVFTWNVNSVKARLERLIAFLARENPDYLCLQELKGLDEIFPWEAVKSAGYHAEVFGQKTFNGVAILSREAPLEVVKSFCDGDEDVQSRVIGARFELGWIFSLYVPNGQSVGSDKYAYKLKWLTRLNHFLQKGGYANQPTLLCGDYNIAPEDRDVHDPKAWEGQVLCSDAERLALKQIYALGFTDLYRKFDEEAGKFTWWDYRNLGFPKNKGMRIDYLLGSKAIADRCVASGICRDERKGALPSDHAPVWSQFKLS